jgi:hypothetical protein
MSPTAGAIKFEVWKVKGIYNIKYEPIGRINLFKDERFDNYLEMVRAKRPNSWHHGVW